MTEHEKLKEICDTIGYKGNIGTKKVEGLRITDNLDSGIINIRVDLDVREIIFTQELMDKLMFYISFNIFTINVIDIPENLLKNLNNPVQYLYNLLNLG